MALVPLNTVLAAPQLCGTIQGATSGIFNPLPAPFFARDKTVEKDYGEYKRVTGSRETARLAAYGSSSQTAQLRDVQDVLVKLLHTVENIHIPIADYTSITEKDSLAVDENGLAEITRQVGEFRKRFDNLRIAAVTSVLFQGAIYYDGQGNLLPSSSGARTTVGFGVPAGNQGQLDVFGTDTPIIDTAWSNSSANIDGQLRELRQASIRLTGYPIRYAFYGKNVPGYLVKNATLKDFFIRANAYNGQYLASADIPNPLLGCTWLPAYEAFFKDQNGNFQSMVGDDQVVFTPEPSLEWFGMLEGKVPVPTTLGTVGQDAAEVIRGGITKVAGMFAYAQLMTDPVSAKMVAGDTFLPVLKVPSAIFQAVVNF